jgi:tRNA pseudouridine65 synthase
MGHQHSKAGIDGHRLCDSDSALAVVYRDESIVAIDKPAGLLVHRSPIDRHETRFAVQILRDQLGQRVYPVHRLDKPTSGLLLFALSAQDARHLNRQFAAHSVAKRYLAIIRGHCPPRGVVDHALRDAPDIGATPRQREAWTAYQRLATTELHVPVDRYPTSRYSLVALHPRTGRRHQLRRHMKHIAHPIIGDTRYGKGVHNRYFRDHFACHRLLLACTGLRIRHPASDEPLSLTLAPASDFLRVMTCLGWTECASMTNVTTESPAFPLK